MSDDDQKPICEDHVIKGRRLSKRLRARIADEVKELTALHSVPPKLVTVIVGDDEGSQMYVRMKRKACSAAGILSDHYGLPEQTTQKELLELIDKLNNDLSVHGILVQLPLPKHIDEKTIIGAISPLKDVDGFTPVNIYNLFYGGEQLSAATPHGIATMLDQIGMNDLSGKHAVIINRSTIVGKPLIFLLLNRNATVTICHSRTANLSEFTKTADVLVTAIGRRSSHDDSFFITPDMVKEDAIIIDVSTPFGDVDFDNVKNKVRCITPVPGGVGPMTITMLLRNVIDAYRTQQEKNI